LELMWSIKGKQRKPSNQVQSRRHTSVGIATGSKVDCRSSIPGRGNKFYSTAFRPVLGPIQPPVQWVTGSSPRGKVAYFLPDINAASTALPNKTCWGILLYSVSSFILPVWKLYS
jgi:hypothetical protein